MGVSVAQVTGGIASLKKVGLVEVNEGILVATAEAQFEFGAPASTPTDTTLVGKFPSASEATGKWTATEGSKAVDITDTDELEDGEKDLTSTETTENVEATVVARSAMAAFVAAADAAPAVNNKTKTAKVKAEAAPRPPTKADKARAVFDENHDRPRCELMALLMAPEVGLTMNGANTYIHNMRKKAGLVKARILAEATETTTVDEPVVVATINATTSDHIGDETNTDVGVSEKATSDTEVA
jgi:hypothetical protein